MGVVLGYPSFPRPCSTVPSQAASALLGSAERKARQELSCSAYNFYPAPPLAQKVPLILTPFRSHPSRLFWSRDWLYSLFTPPPLIAFQHLICYLSLPPLQQLIQVSWEIYSLSV